MAVMLDFVTAARNDAFVGRAGPVAAFERALAASGRLVYVHGPGGVGKTALLRQFAARAERTLRTVVWVDARDAGRRTPSPGHVLGGRKGAVLLADTAEELAPLDRWLTEEAVADLPDDTLIALASRDPPPLAWRVDAGWRRLLEPVPLANFSPALLASRLIHATGPAAGTADRVRALQVVIREAAGQLARSPRDIVAHRALHHTYLQPAGTQRRACDLLNLPTSTYRRHLAAGVNYLIAVLWQQECDAASDGLTASPINVDS